MPKLPKVTILLFLCSVLRKTLMMKFRVATSPGKPGKCLEFKKWSGKLGKLKKLLKKSGKNLENYLLSFVELRDLLFTLNVLR